MPPNNKNDLIGQIYETALSPGDWVDLLDAIASWTEGDSPDTWEGGASSPLSTAVGTPANTEVEQLVSHLDRAVRSSAYMHALEDRTQVLNAMYNQMPWPMLMLDEQMRVVECNAVAHQVLNDGPVQLRADGSLSFSDRSLMQSLASTLALAEGRDTRLLNSREGNVALLCLPVRKSDAPGTIAKVRTIVWVLSGHNVVTPSPEALGSLFEITPAESRLLHLLCKLGNLNQSAELLNISIHTARTQLKSTMSKLNASSQVQLVSQVMGHALVQAAKLPQVQQDKEFTVTLPDGRVLSWYEYGDPAGRPVLTMENLGAAVPDHDWFADWYREQGLRMIVIVRPGYGISTYKPDFEFRDFGKDIQFLCVHLGLNRPPMAAYCAGGPYALCAAAQYPEIFDRLGLLASTVPIEHFELDKLDALHSMFLRLFRRDPRLFVMVGRLGIRGVQKAPESFFARLAKGLCEEDRAILNNPDILQRTIKCMRRSHFQGARILIEEYLRLQKPWQVDLGKIRIPIMHWHGEDDRIISIGSARGLSSELPGNRFRSFPGKGRFMVYSVWKAFLSELLELPAGAAES
ncbi:MAG: alpha/beta fold hydrolase [Alcanivorax nanhaiticus]